MADPAENQSPCPAKVSAATIAIVKHRRYQIRLDGQQTSTVILEPQLRLQHAGTTVSTICHPHLALNLHRQSLAAQDTEAQMTLFAGDAFDAAEWLMTSSAAAAERADPCVLDFASDSEPGGGFRGKQRGTQEEDLCRRSNLGACLVEHFERVGPALYMPSLAVVYAPDIVVFRSSKTYRLLERPFWVAVVAAALRSTESQVEIDAKIDGILQVAISHGHRYLVLGAWGCGAFGNDPDQIALGMASAVQACKGCFDHIMFAVPRGTNFDAFRAALPTIQVVGGSSVPSDNVAPPKLNDQHKWELLTILNESMDEAITRLGFEPRACRSNEGARRCAVALLQELKALCIAELAKATSPELMERLRCMLPPLPAQTSQDGLVDLTETERDICSTFQEVARKLVMNFVKQQRLVTA